MRKHDWRHCRESNIEDLEADIAQLKAEYARYVEYVRRWGVKVLDGAAREYAKEKE